MKNYPTKYDLKELFKLHEEGWLKMSQYKDQLYIFCYSPKCQYEKFWTPLTLSMRGMVLGREGEVIGQCLPKFFNLSEVPETRAENLPRESYEIFTKLDGCFGRLTPVLMADGTSKTIKEIVDSPNDEYVLGYRDGAFVPSKVIGKTNNGLKTNWVVVRYSLKDATYSKSRISGKVSRALTVTTNHKFYTEGGYVPIRDLSVGDTVTTLNYVPNKDLDYLINCFLLGDASLRLSVNNAAASISVAHKDSHIEYLNYKMSLLKRLNLRVDHYKSGYGTSMTRVYTRLFKSWLSYKDIWYSDNGRKVPENIDWLDDFAVALWYMDDGSLTRNSSQTDRAIFSTYRYKDTDIQRLADKLSSQYNVSVSVQQSKKGTTLRINAGRNNEIDNFWFHVTPYIPTSMRYKVPERFRELPFIDMSTKLEADVVLQSMPCVIESIEPHKKSKTMAYDIQTETANYIAGGLVVHNSMISTFYNPYEERWQHTSKCSFDNEYIEAAYRFLPQDRLRDLCPYYNLTSEVRFDTDPMRRVTDMPEGLYLLTSWEHLTLPTGEKVIREMPRTTSETIASNMGMSIAAKHDDKLDSKLESFNSEKNTEGYVVRFESGFRTKLKTAWYLHLNKVLDDFGPGKARETVKEYLTNYDMTMEWVKYLPDEMWQEAEDIAGQILEDYNNQIYWVDRYFHRNYSKDKKTFALAVKDLPEAPYLFSKYKDPEGEAYKKLIWKNI